MINEQILKKAIEKTVKNGYKFEKDLKKNWLVGATFALNEDEGHAWYDLTLMKEVILFSHDFARAFWGNGKKRCNYCINKEVPCEFHLGITFVMNWQFHLQQMVLEKEPLKYIEKFL